MSTFEANNPLTWTMPTNYIGSSCFVDSMLWALLYKIDNPFYKFILETNFTPDSNADTLKKVLLAFYGGIHSNNKFSREQLKNMVGAVRLLLKKEMHTGQQDTNEFFTYIKEILEKDIKSHNLTITTTSNMEEFDENKSPVDYKPVPSVNTGDIICVNSISAINFNDVEFNINDNELTITKPKETYDPPIQVTDDNHNPTGHIYTSKQEIVKYKRNNKVIDYLIIPISRVNSENYSKNIDPITILNEISGLFIHSIVVHQGDSSSGHYVCYFKVNNNWYLFNDVNEKVKNMEATNLDELIKQNQEVLINCACLFYTTNGDSQNPINQDGFKKYYDFVDKYTEQNKAKITPPRIAKESVARPGSTSTTPNPTPKNTVQIANRCEKYGQEWLNLFIDANAAPGSTVRLTTNPETNTKVAEFFNKQNVLTTVDVPENCTFVEPTLSRSNSASQPGTPVLSQEQQMAAADIALENAKKSSDLITNVSVREVIKNAEKGKNTDIMLLKKVDKNVNYNLIYYKNNVYVVGNINSQQKLLYNINDNTIYNLGGTKKYKLINGETIDNFVPLQSQPAGGTRKKRNITIKSGKKTKKGVKCKKTRKLIRHKNKLHSNKLKTNKLRGA